MRHHHSPTRSAVLLLACGLAAGAGLRVARFMRKRRSSDYFRGEVHKPYAGYALEPGSPHAQAAVT